MITCPNKNLKEWKDLVSQVGEARAGLLWVMVDGETSKLEEVNFELKSVNILQSNKAKEIFEKGKKNNWDLNKILTELQVPKEQKQLILDLNITDRGKIISNIEPTKGVPELFESNPDLANAVYEALGLINTSEIQLDKPAFNPDNYEATSYPIKINDKYAGVISINKDGHISSSIGMAGVELKKEFQGKGYGTKVYIALAEQLAKEGKTLKSEAFGKQDINEAANRVWKSLLDKGYAVDRGSYFEVQLKDKQQAQQLYSQYLNAIFPDSKVKDIVYHKTPFSFDKFEKPLEERKLNKENKSDAIFFNFENKGFFRKQEGAKTITAIINTINNKVTNENIPYASGSKQDIKNILQEDFDSITVNKQGGNKELLVFEPEQIHILGSKQDIKGFKEYISQSQQSDLREQLALELASNYSYSVEINTAKEKSSMTKEIKSVNGFSINGDIYDRVTDEDIFGVNDREIFTKNNKEISEQEYRDALFEYNTRIETPTQHYSNLSAPGGTGRNKYEGNPDWEYQELAIQTPLIQNISTAHISDFSNNIPNMLGWARVWYNRKTGTVEIQEIQSDLFQKGRDKKILVNGIPRVETGNLITNEEDIPFGDEPIKEFKDDTTSDKYKANQFLQLLNKDSNWVTFFIKSIIQDSAKKGYEKVLFPRLDTIIQIESAGNYKSYADAEKAMKDENWYKKDKDLKEKLEETRKELKNKKEEVAKIKSNPNYDRTLDYDTPIQNLERLVSQAYEKWHAIQPTLLNTAKFYENDITNVLNKQYGKENVKQVTDEYGNTWNEVTLEKKNLETILFSKKPQPRKEPNDLHSKLTAKDIYGKRYIQPIGSTGQYRILKDWKAKGLSLVKKLENEYPGVLSWKTVNNEVIISVNPQMGLKFSKESSTEKVSEDVLIPILDKLKARFNLDYKIINDPSLDWAGTYDGNVVVINSAKAGLDTPFHEFAHPFIRIIRNTNRPLYNRLVKEINDTKEGKVALEGVKQDYPELKDTDQVEEAIVTLIGAYAEDNLKSKSLIKRIQEFLQEILNRLGLSKINPKDLSNLSLRELGAIMASDLDVDISQAKQFVGEGAVFKSKKEEAPKQAFEKQFVYFTRRIYRLEKDLKNAEEGSTKYNQLKAELDTLQEQLKVANEEQSRAAYLELGSHMLSRAEAFIKMLETDKASVSKDNLLFTINTIATFNDFTGLKDKSAELLERVYPFLSQHTLEVINKYNTEGKEITQDMIDKQDTDISAFTKSVGALSDLANYIGRTIGSLIKAAQNRASSTNKALLKKVQAEVDKLEEFAKSNNMKLEDVYNMMIDTVEVTSDDVKYKDLALVAPYINGKQNPKWEVLNRPENKAVKDFYNFYQDIMSKASNNLPYKVSKHHIPNIAKTDIKYRLKNILKVEDVLLDEFRTTEDLHADMVPSMFRAKLDIDKKSRDLGASILEFAAYSNMHHELSQALPEARLLQEQILYEQKANGVVEERKYVKSTDPKTKINAKDSYLYKMVDIVIDMQLKGKMTKDIFKPVKTKKILDENGEVIGYKQVRIDDALDLGLKYNSLLRIGLSPITALANVSFGDISNIIESIGGRFFGFKELRQATNIFFSQIDYVSNEKNSELYKWLDALNPLQELDDYNISDKVRLNKMTPEKAQEYMYAMQKKGELFLQSRTMLAVLIKEKYMTKDGKTTKEGLKLMQDPEALQKMSDKIQRLNQMIHGRYSQREAATAQQSVLYRMMIQFRKWIPSAIEARFGEKQHDNRLGEEIEGRYRTFYSLITNLSDSIERLKSGKLTELEIYNMKKNLTEIVLLTASILGYAWLHGGDDEEAKKRRKNPYVKTLLTLTDRVSGDLGFFYNPANYTNLAKNAIPLAKTVDDLRKVVMNIPYAFYVGEWEVKKGNLKGTNKFYSSAKKVMIGLKPLQDIEKLFNENPLDEFH